MLRVLFITGEYPPMQGGVGDYTWTLGSTLISQGLDIHVLTSQEAGPSHLSPRGVSNVYPLVPAWGWGMRSQVAELVQDVQPDVVHIQYQAAAFRLHPAINLLPRFLHGRRRSVQVAVTFHDLRVPYLFPKAGPLRWRSNLELARRSDLAIVTNAEDHIRLHGYADLGGKLREIPIGANVQPDPPAGFDRNQQRARWDVGPQDLLLCYFGFLNASKGAEELVTAVAQVASSGAPVHLLMLGGQVGASDPTNQAYLEQVRALIENLGIAPRVHWTGFTEASQVSANFLASDIAVLPYRDGVSFRRGSLMAAIAHSLPVISTEPAVAIPEIVHGETMWLAPVGSAEALADAIGCLWNDPDLRQRLSAGSAQLARRFTWEAIAQQHVQVYRELIDRPAN
jgi:glycosyltransferase involved in cell wall biosynthesis